MKPLIIYHAGCTDGFGAAYAAWLKFGDEAIYVPLNYGKINTVEDIRNLLSEHDITTVETRVYVLDFSLPREVTEWLIEETDAFTWLDHHKTAFEMWCNYENGEREYYHRMRPGVFITLDNNKSGAMLAWGYFHPDTPIPDFIKFIDDRDRWQWKYENSAAFHAGMQARKPWTFEQWNMLDISDGGFYRAIDEGVVLLKAQDAQVKSIVKYAMKCVIPYFDGVTETRTGLVVNTNVHMSEIGNELANQSGTYGLVWYLGTDGTAKVSLRSNGDYDVSAIAKQFGGGGHKNAAGFTVPITTLLSWLK